MKFIAEIGNNHNGDLTLAKQIADSAITAGADIVKFQVYRPDTFMAKDSTYFEELSAEALPFEYFGELKTHIESKGCKFLATPFDSYSLALLDELNCDEIKISSGDFDNFDLLGDAIVREKKIIMSVGGGTIEEIDNTIAFLNEKRADFMLLHCALAYPAAFTDLNLQFITTLKSRYNVQVGFSDHSLGVEAAIAAVALGAEMVEKHFTTDQDLPGGDNSMSILPEGFAQMVDACRNIELALGCSSRLPTTTEQKVRKLIKRTYHAAHDISGGSYLTDSDIILLRSSDSEIGFYACAKESLLGKRLKITVKKGQVIESDFIYKD